MKRFLTVCAALALMAVMALPASAAGGTDPLTAAGALSDRSEVLAEAPAVVFNYQGECTVITNTSVGVDGAAAYVVLLNDELVLMSDPQELEVDLAEFTVDASYLSAPEVLSPARSVQVEEPLTYYFYYIQDGETLTGSTSAKIVEQNGNMAFDYTLPSGVDKAQLRYPAIAVNRAGELVIIKGEQNTIPMCDIDEGGTAPTAAPAPTRKPDDPASTDTPKGRDDPSPAPTSEPDSGSGLSTETIVAIAAGGALAVGGIAFFLKKKNSGGSQPPVQPPIQPPIQPPVQPIAPTAPMDPVPPAPPVPDIPERIEPVEIKPQPQPMSSALYLYCEGGAMDGRRYPVGTTTILIGRDPSCNIRYPGDTKGVSRRHCEIFWKNGVLNIMDLGSTSGTFIRGKGQIAANAPVPVNAGDTFYLGEKRNAFVIRMGG